MPRIQLTTELVATSPADLARIITETTDQQVTAKDIKSTEGSEEFRISTDALHYHRVAWRCREEWGDPDTGDVVTAKVKHLICRHRKYDQDEFLSVLEATRARARLPFGWTALDLAASRSKRNPISLMNQAVAESRLATIIASLALQLQLYQGDAEILLPIEPLRILIAARKVTVSGTITRLVDAGLLSVIKSEYNTGSAREFRFIGQEHHDFLFVPHDDTPSAT